MTDALSLDLETVAAQLPPRKRSGRPHGIGSSDVALAMLSSGRRPMDSAPRWMREKAAMMKRCGLPRWQAEKLGIAARPPMSATQHIGIAREPQVLSAWIERLERDEWTCEEERAIDPDSVVWCGVLPDEWPPLHDRDSPIVVKPDAWARRWDGSLVSVSVKCARYGYDKPAWWNGATEAPWYYATQVVAEFAALRSRSGFLVVGCGWIREEDDGRSDGPLLALPVHRDEREVEEVRAVAREAWAQIAPRISRG